RSLTPRLDDPVIWSELDVAAFNETAEQLQASAWLSLYLRGASGEGAELFRVQQDLVDAGRGHSKIYFLVDCGSGLSGLGLAQFGGAAAENQNRLAAGYCGAHDLVGHRRRIRPRYFRVVEIRIFPIRTV